MAFVVIIADGDVVLTTVFRKKAVAQKFCVGVLVDKDNSLRNADDKLTKEEVITYEKFVEGDPNNKDFVVFTFGEPEALFRVKLVEI